MKQYYNCPHCRKKTFLKRNYCTKQDMLNEKGPRITHQCFHCDHELDIHINNVRAVKSASFFIWMAIGGLIAALGILSVLEQGNLNKLAWLVAGALLFAVFQIEHLKVKKFNKPI